MSAMESAIDFNLPRRTDNLGYLAPLFRQAVEAALAEFNKDKELGHRAIVYETYRSDSLQLIYYARGRQVRPPEKPVTNAKSNLFSWHGYGLAVDVIHEKLEWDAPTEWFHRVADVFKAHGCKWGGDWTRADLPHLQWGKCKPSPSDNARELIATRGVAAVWQAVGAASPA